MHPTLDFLLGVVSLCSSIAPDSVDVLVVKTLYNSLVDNQLRIVLCSKMIADVHEMYRLVHKWRKINIHRDEHEKREIEYCLNNMQKKSSIFLLLM